MLVDIKNLTKYYGKKKAVDVASLEIGRGEIVGVLGRNGAGKTTLMRVLTGFLSPSSGKVTVGGCDIVKNSPAAKALIGYLPENPPLYLNMSVYDYLLFAAQLKDVPNLRLRAEVARVLDVCDIKDVKSELIYTLSKGYRQRVGIAQAIINDPKLIILDEPTSGLDPLQIFKVRALIRNLGSERTVILSTHILSEIDQTVQRVIILKEGKIVLDCPSGRAENNASLNTLEETFLNLHKEDMA
ncbi:MAG: ABC transporter ATP-binding protein [Candidatus Omnitrophica bacterium]|nr:ABC transporter ATP-binding protein [Candidatus Omnitrophota bacterium]